MTTKENYYSVSTLQIWKDGNFAIRLLSDYVGTHAGWAESCLNQIYFFHMYKNKTMFLNEVRQLLNYKANGYSWKHERRDLAAKGYYFGLGETYTLNHKTGENDLQCIVVKEDIIPDYNLSDEKRFYFELFPYRLTTLADSRIDELDNFINFQLRTIFKGNVDEFKLFLNKICVTKKYILGDLEQIILGYLRKDFSTKATEEDSGFFVKLDESTRTFILNKFKKISPEEIIILLYALESYGFINENDFTYNKTKTFKIVESFFGKGNAGTRQGLNSAFNVLANDRDKFNSEIAKLRLEISKVKNHL